MRSFRERGQGDTFRHREQLVDGSLSGSDRAAVRACPGDDEQHMIDPGVPALEHDSPCLRLEVVDPGFRLRRQERGGRSQEAADHPVPRALIALDQQGHLGSQLQVGMQPCAQTVEERELP